MGGPWVLGLSAEYHNGAACLLHGDELVVAVQEERLSGKKRIPLSARSIEYCLEAAGIEPDEVDLVVTTSHPGRQRALERLQASSPVFAREVRTAPHHLCHAMGAFALSGFEEAAVLVADGAGTNLPGLLPSEREVVRRPGSCHGVEPERLYEHLSLYRIGLDGVTPLEKHVNLCNEIRWGEEFRSFGHMFNYAAYQIFGQFFEAGKVMGLAPYGRPRAAPEELFRLEADGVEFASELPAALRGVPRAWDRALDPDPADRRPAEDLAATVQGALEAALLHFAARARELTHSSALCYAGGVALNSVANERLVRESGFERIYLMPASEDNGLCIGAAYHGLWQLEGARPGRRRESDSLGRVYAPTEIEAAIERLPGLEVVETDDPLEEVVSALCAGQIVGWFQGGSEFGPRALGSRSILCDPRRPDAKETLNARVKRREGFRPFAPAVLLEEAERWFEVGDGVPPESPFMLRVCPFREEVRARVPGVVHVDGTGRYQTLTAETNGPFYRLVQRFFARTGVPLLLNTSFNVQGEAIVETPQDALWCMLGTEIDCVLLGQRLVRKQRGFSLLELRPRLLDGEPSGRLDPWTLHRCDGVRSLGEVVAPSAAAPFLSLRRQGFIEFEDS